MIATSTTIEPRDSPLPRYSGREGLGGARSASEGGPVSAADMVALAGASGSHASRSFTFKPLATLPWVKALVAILLGTTYVHAQDAARTLALLQPRPFTLPKGEHKVANLLAELEKQTGNRLLDRRSNTNTKVDIGFDGQTFWQAVDRLAEKLDARLSLYSDDGIALVDGPRQAGTMVHTGICRLEIKSLEVKRDVEANRRTCVIQVEIAWEPRFEPLYLTVDNVKGAFAADARGQERTIEPIRGVAQSVPQRRAQVVELRMPGPERSSPSLASLTGELRFLGPAQMLTARFASLKPGPQTQAFTADGVTVRLKRVAANARNWTFDLDLENPDGTAFESYQSWIDNNRIHLERLRGGKKEIWAHRPHEMQSDLNGPRAQLSYFFEGAQGKGDPSEWTLVYRTPGRIVPLTVPFEFRNEALP
jgi:hypothetical protein